MEKPSLTIRSATLHDLPGLHRIAERAVWELLVEHYTTRQMEATRAVQGYYVEADLVEAGTYYVLEVGGVLVAGSGWSDSSGFHPQFPSNADHKVVPLDVQPDTAVMRATYVDPDWVHRGFATLLARVTETAAALAGYRRFEALCTPASEAVRAKLGYRVVELVELPLTDGVSIGMAHMRKELAAAPVPAGVQGRSA